MLVGLQFVLIKKHFDSEKGVDDRRKVTTVSKTVSPQLDPSYLKALNDGSKLPIKQPTFLRRSAFETIP
jgi:hypothetical protein